MRLTSFQGVPGYGSEHEGVLRRKRKRTFLKAGQQNDPLSHRDRGTVGLNTGDCGKKPIPRLLIALNQRIEDVPVPIYETAMGG